MKLINNKILVGLLVLIVILFVAYPKLIKKEGSGVVYKTEAASVNDIVSSITASGTLNPITTIEVAATTGGAIKNIYVDYNVAVKKGDPLADIDPLPLQNELKRATADYKKAQSELNLANSALKSNKELFEQKLISGEELDASQGRYSSAQAAYEQYGVALEIAESNLESSTIRSPIDGIVLSKNLVSGERVLPNSKTLFLIAQDLSRMRIDTNVNEADIGKIEKNQKAFFTVDAYPALTFEGTVTQIVNEPRIKNNVVTYDVHVTTDNEDLKLKPGMTAEVSIIVADKKNVLSVPTSAVRFLPPSTAKITQEPEKDKLLVWVPAENDQIRPVTVQIGVSDERSTEIVNGSITEGQEVIVEAVDIKDTDRKSKFLPQPRRF